MSKELMIAAKLIAAIADSLRDGKITADEAYKIGEIIVKGLIDMFMKGDKEGN